jgi:hypothetical protein
MHERTRWDQSTATQDHSRADPDQPDEPKYGQSGQVHSTVKRLVGVELRCCCGETVGTSPTPCLFTRPPSPSPIVHRPSFIVPCRR